MIVRHVHIFGISLDKLAFKKEYLNFNDDYAKHLIQFIGGEKGREISKVYVDYCTKE